MRGPKREHATSRATVAVAAAFVVLGLPDGALGVSWPAMRDDFDRSTAGLSWLVAGVTAGYLSATAATGRLSRRWGTARVGSGGAVVLAGGLLLLGLAPAWPLAVLAAAVWGAGGGALDAGLNADVARRADGRTMGLLHAGYGLGASGGPLLAGGLVATGAGWRPAWMLLAVASTVGLVAGRRLRDEPHHAIRTRDTAGPAPSLAASAVGAAAFFVYVCVEVGAGHWAFTALVEGAGSSVASASLWVASYWVAMTLGRLWLGLHGYRLPSRSLLGASAGGALAGAALLAGGMPAGLPVLGLSLAAIFPTLVLRTPSQVGDEQAAGTIGWQLAAAGAGGAAGPAVVGVVLENAGIAAYGPTVLVLAVLLALAITGTVRAS